MALNDGSNGHRTESEGGERHRGQRCWRNICAIKSWSSDKSSSLSWEFRDDNETIGNKLSLDMLVARERNTNCRGLERVAHAGRILENACQFRFFVRLFDATVQKCAVFELMRLLKSSFTSHELSFLTRVRTDQRRRLIALTKRNWDNEPKKRNKFGENSEGVIFLNNMLY